MANVTTKVVARGNTSPQEQPAVVSGKVGAYTVVKTWRGMYNDLLQMRPKAGVILQGYNDLGTLVASDISLTGTPGNTGTLTVKYGPPDINPGESTDAGELSITFDAVEKPIMTHEKYKEADPGVVEAWRRSPPAMAMAGQYEDKDGEPVDLKGKDREVAWKIAQGIESWLFFAPVVKITRRFDSRPSGAGKGNGKIEEPPVKVDGGWQFLRLGDDLSRDAAGVWTWTRTWQGAKEWDKDLYDKA